MANKRKTVAYFISSVVLVGGIGIGWLTRSDRGFRLLVDYLYRDFEGVAVISPDELAIALKRPQQPALLDIRTPEEYAVSHLNGARLVSPEQFSVDSLTDISKNQEIVLYCSIGYRSARIAEQLSDAGYTNVKNLYGGIFNWNNQGLPIYRDGQQVAQIHPYNSLWGTLITRGETATMVADSLSIISGDK